MTETICERHGRPYLRDGPYRKGDCRRCWVAAGGETRPGVRERGPCLHLGRRVEYRPGCNGRLCLHQCEAGEPAAVPGGVCQTCPKYEADA